MMKKNSKSNAKNSIKVQPANNTEDLINKKLPKELIIRIFSYLDVVTLCRCAQVSKYWNTLALDGSNWQDINLFYFQTDIKGAVVENLSKRCGGFLKQIQLENCRWISDDAIKKLCMNCKNIEILNVKQCNKLTDQSAIHVSRNLHNLNSINLESTHISDCGLKAISEGCKNLQSVNVSWCVNLTVDGITYLGNNCSNLKVFIAKGLTMINDTAIKQLSEKCKNLLHVCLHSCVNITDDGCVTLASNCHSLKYVCVSNCKNLTDLTLNAFGKNCHDLKILEASSCCNFSDVGFMTLAKGCQLLERLDLEECNRITDLTLQNFSLYCTNLRHLTLSRCEAITDEGIKQISTSHCASESLQVLELDNCPLITDASLEQLYSCQGLTEIELYDCQLITKNGIKKFQAKLPNVKVHAYFAPTTPAQNQRPSRTCSCRCCNVL